MEIVNLLISQAKKATPAGAILTSQDKYVSRMKQELMGSVGTSFEPLLERYIGHRVVLELIRGDKILEYCDNENCTSIFIGYKGIGENNEMYIGSTADKIARKAEVPVIVVR